MAIPAIAPPLIEELFFVVDIEESGDEPALLFPALFPVGAEIDEEKDVVPSTVVPILVLPVFSLCVPVEVCAAPTPKVVVVDPEIMLSIPEAEVEVRDGAALEGLEAPGPAFAA